MGHVRLGRLNRTKAWKDVIALISLGADARQIAQATLNAAKDGFSFTKICNDAGFQKAVELLVQLGIAAKSNDFIDHLRSQGMELSNSASIDEIKANIYEIVDHHCMKTGSKTDLGEIAVGSLVGAVSHVIKKNTENLLWSPTAEDYKSAFNNLGKPEGFGEVAVEFFSQVTDRCVQNYLSHITTGELGSGQRFATIHQEREFKDSMTQHCRETAVVVRQYSTDWFAKHFYVKKEQSPAESTSGYANFAMKKMTEALEHDNKK